MAFGNISTVWIPIAANAGSSQWGTDVRKLLDSADVGASATTITDHGTGGAVTRTFRPYVTTASDYDQSLYGWAITPSDMNSVAGARRFFPAGNHTLTVRMSHSGATAQTGTLSLYAYRVASAAGGRTRTLLGSGSASVSLPALAGAVTATAAFTLSEVIFDPDETVQYSFEFNVAGIVITGETVTFYAGTNTTVNARLDIPRLGVLADTTGTATGTGAASGVTGQVLNTTEAEQKTADFVSGSETKAPPRSVLAFAGAA